MIHTVDVLEEILDLASRQGFEVRREWLGESTGGACRIGQRWILYVDLSLPADEQLQQVVAALRGRLSHEELQAVSPPLRRCLLGK